LFVLGEMSRRNIPAANQQEPNKKAANSTGSSSANRPLQTFKSQPPVPMDSDDTHWNDQASEWLNLFDEGHSPQLIPNGFHFPANTQPLTTNSLPSSSAGVKQRLSSSSTYEKKKISDAITYGPRFVTIFQSFCKHYGLNIDLKKHLLVLCLENLIEFIKWARENDSQIKWINEMLYENDYLRPEVRNGIVMVLIYTFAATKATIPPSSSSGGSSSDNASDMFTALQDNETGLGIANKFSLKIYNDPFNYLTFLKISISALIDAGVIPDNERQNQPGMTTTTTNRRSKSLVYNAEEVNAFYSIQKQIISLIEVNNQTQARHLVQVMTTHWQLRGKVSETSVLL
jgi:hypothetical protein